MTRFNHDMLLFALQVIFVRSACRQTWQHGYFAFRVKNTSAFCALSGVGVIRCQAPDWSTPKYSG